jgi:DNA-binding CsgD family transcriptional regulator
MGYREAPGRILIHTVEFVYYSICQALAVAGLLMTAANAFARRDPLSRWYFFVYCGLALITMSMTFNSMMPVGSAHSEFFHYILSATALLGVPVSIFTMPRFVRCLVKHPGQKAVIVASGVLSLTSLAIIPCTLLNLPIWVFYFVCLPHDIVLALCGVYTAVAVRVALNRARKDTRSLPAIWRSFFPPVFWAMVILLPIELASDLVQLPQAIFGIKPPLLMPLFAASFSVSWFYATLKNSRVADRARALAPAAAAGTQSEEYDWAPLRLSARESEVAKLLLEGLAYREIGDRLCVSLATIKSHVLSVYQKAGVKDKLGLLHAVKRRP